MTFFPYRNLSQTVASASTRIACALFVAACAGGVAPYDPTLDPSIGTPEPIDGGADAEDPTTDVPRHVDSSGSTGTYSDAGTSDLEIAVGGDLSVLAGNVVHQPVIIHRTGNTPISIHATGMLGGVTSPAITVASTNDVTLTFSAIASAKQGPAHIDVYADSTDGRAHAHASFELEVRGPSGTLDRSYGVDGVAYAQISGVPTTAILDAAGTMYAVFDGNRVARISATGLSDTSFGTAGTTTALANGTCNALAEQADGSIVCAGTESGHLALRRFTVDGKADSTFGTNGAVVASIPGALYDVAIQSDGAVLGVGDCNNGTGCMWRVSSTGLSDAAYGAAGFALLDAGRVAGVTLLPTGEAIVAKTFIEVGKSAFRIEKVASSGTIDTSFGSYVSAGPQGHKLIKSAVAPNGSFTFFGEYSSFTNLHQTALARFGLAGLRDGSFGTSGVILRSSSAYVDGTVQADGRVLLLTTSGVLRLTAAGAEDTSFGTGGTTDPISALLPATPHRVLVDAKGRIVVLATDPAVLLARYWP